MKVLVLYSWEENQEEAKQWATSMCYELSKYENIDARCDMFWKPKSNVKKAVYENIKKADKIIVIVTDNYNYKVSNLIGMVSFEEKIYSEIILNDGSYSRILFILKEKEIDMPKNWENYVRIDVSEINEFEYLSLPNEKKKAKFDRIARFCLDLPEYILPSQSSNESNNKPLPQEAQSYDDLFKSIIKKKGTLIPSIAEQERRLIKYLKRNINDKTFVFDYLRSGLAADLSFSGRITPELFIKYFWVKRSDTEERRYNDCVRSLFNSDSYNVLCLQSDGGSGKSVFVQSLAHRGKCKKGQKYIYYNILFDLCHLHDNQLSKEELLYQKLRKEYMRMSRDDVENKTFVDLWRKSFAKKLSLLEDAEYEENHYLFKLKRFREKLKEASTRLLPKNCDLDNWYYGYSSRLAGIKSSVKDKNVLFMILLALYLLILLCKPSYDNDKGPRYVLVFDNIETYDNGEEAKAIAQYIIGCHSFLKKMFNDIGEENAFFTKFTFVFVLRTSTFFRFGSLQVDMLRGGAFNKQIKFFDFTLEAMLKKLKFLQKIKDYQNSVLYKELYLLLCILVPSQLIDKYMNNDLEGIDFNYRYFASHRLIPLFNNDFRKTVDYLYRAVMDDELYDKIIGKLKIVDSYLGNSYDCGINGIRMGIIRFIFNDLRINQYFEKIGFPGLSGNEEHSMTRILLSFLYWDEIKSIATHNEKIYKGVSLDRIFNIFKYFCDINQIIQMLYDLSVYVNNDFDRKEALDAWGNLITFTNLQNDIKSFEFYESASKLTYENNQESEIALDKVFVKLSDAGMCFSQYYSRNIEFIMSRSKSGADVQSLFFIDNVNDIRKILSEYYNIIINCIEKMIGRCEPICTLYGHEKRECVLYSNSKDKYSLFSCSLFIRYQECLDLIREALNYIDRYRIVIYDNNGDEEIKKEIVNQLRKFYGLYTYTRKKMLRNANGKCKELKVFMKNWDYPSNKTFNCNIDSDNKLRIEYERPVQSYYASPKENFKLALNALSIYPKTRLHQLIIDISNKNIIIEQDS